MPTKPGVLVHPTSIYELVMAILIFAFLWSIRKKPNPSGTVFSYYLILSGISRFIIEFIRINPVVAAGLSQAQIVSVILILIGIVILMRIRKEAVPSVR